MKTINLALLLILSVVLFTLISQRLLIQDVTVPNRFEKKSQLQSAKQSVKETGDRIWNTLSDINSMVPTWTIGSDTHESGNELAGPASSSLPSTLPPQTSTTLPKSESTSTSNPAATSAPDSSSSAWGANENIISLTDPEEPEPIVSIFDGLLPQFLPVKSSTDSVPNEKLSIISAKVYKEGATLVPPASSVVKTSAATPKTAVASVPEDVAMLVPQFLPLSQTPAPTSNAVNQKPKSKLPSDPDLHLLHHEYEDHGHPRLSPRPGTHIGADAATALLNCPKQAKCIVPQLQLKIKMKVYLCRHPTNSGIRFYFLTREGLMLHPNVEVIKEESRINEADFIFYLPGSAPWHLTECTNMSYVNKLIVLDEFDGHTPFYPRKTAQEMKQDFGKNMVWYFMYFKRSFVARKDGRFLRYPMLDLPDVFPLTYSISDTYSMDKFNHVREVDIMCTLRGSALMTTRQRVQDWIAEYATNRNVSNVIASEVTKESRKRMSKMYFQHMYNSKIIVTVNPANWEGDFRLWESLASGALVMVDPLFVPHPFPLIDGVHVVYFNNQKKDELFQKLDYYRSHPDEARKIAIAGYLHCMKHHRTVSMIDYILRSAHIKRATLKNALPIPKYYYSAQYLNYEANIQGQAIKANDKPGIYKLMVMANHTALNHTHHG